MVEEGGAATVGSGRGCMMGCGWRWFLTAAAALVAEGLGLGFLEVGSMGIWASGAAKMRLWLV